MPWFPLPMPENEVDLLDGFRRSTRPATVSEKPMPNASLEGGWISWGIWRERLLLRDRSRDLRTINALQIPAFPHCRSLFLPVTSDAEPRVLLPPLTPVLAADLP